MDISTFATTNHRIPTTLSVRSLDVGQLISANVVQNSSLLSESVTHVSDLSDSSFSGNLPAFPLQSLPGKLATVSLGEHLKMFPGTTPTTASRIMLAAPTSPRLRSMCKECLSISKWAEFSMGWDAPGHVPWENRLDYTIRKWLPEGSLFSSESFSRGLFHARNWRTVVEPDPSRPVDIKMGDINSEIMEMMRELHNLRSYFAETVRDDADLGFDLNSSLKPPVPALVVSTSYMTVPLTSLESSQSLSPNSACGIASRRGREAPPPLTIQTENPPCTILHPDIPTGSLSDNFHDHPMVIIGAENREQPPLCVEHMISNLRLQCSNMSLSASLPGEDTSWNSRSPMPPVSDNEPDKPDQSNAAENKQTSATSFVAPGDNKSLSMRRSDSRLKGKINQSKVNYKKRTSTDLSSAQPPLARNSSVRTKTRNVASTPTKVIVQKIPRSAMAKNVTQRSQKPYQMVRFALPKNEVEADFVGSAQPPPLLQSLSATDLNNHPDSKVNILPDDTPKPILISPPVRLGSVSVRKDNGGVLTSESSRHEKARRSIIPSRKIAVARESAVLKAPTTESGNTTQIRRAHTLSVHPFSRIIKRPMLALKENKRATIAVDSLAFKTSNIDEKRRMSGGTIQGNSKKNRIKSLLYRFK